MLEQLKAFLKPGYGGTDAIYLKVKAGTDLVPVLISGNVDSGSLLFLTPGFGSRLTDYGPIVRTFEKAHLVVRMVHPGSSRWSFLQALVRLLWVRGVRGLPLQEAARVARSWIHRPSNRQRRLRQLQAVVAHVSSRFPSRSISLAGHSFGSDTAILGALEQKVQNLYLFSPHPPGYLVPMEDYARLCCEKVWIVTGTRDRTRDGVGPEERLKVALHIPTEQLREVCCLEGVGHMDFALAPLAPKDLQDRLEALFR
jgi:hypothetical protein